MAKNVKTVKTVRNRKVTRKKSNQDSDFFKFDDNFENNDYSDKYKASWNNDGEEIKVKKTTKTTYKVEDSGNDFYLKEESDNTKLLTKLNKYARITLKVVIVISILIIIDLFLITRFEFGPLFAIRTKTYNDGGTKVYHGIGYKVIRYNVKNGREGLVVGNYSLKYTVTPKKISLSNKKLTEDNNGDYVQINGLVTKIDEKNKRIVLKNGKITVYCDMKEFKNYDKISVNKNINISGRIYVESNTKLYLDKGVVK